VSDGLHIRWRETAPDRGVLAFALAEIDALHRAWPETMQCNIVIERAPAEEGRVHAHVELDLGRRSPRVRAKGTSLDAYAALRHAFRGLRASMPAYAGRDVVKAPLGAHGSTPYADSEAA